MSNEFIKTLATDDNSLAPELSDYCTKTKVKFNGSCLKQDKVTYNHRTVVKIYIVYELSSTLNSFDPTLDCLFGAVKLTKNTYICK